MCPVKLLINDSLLPRNTENLTAVGFEPNATEVTDAWNQRLRPLRHAILRYRFVD